MNKKTIVILSALIACCLAVVLVVHSKSGEDSGKLYSGDTNLIVGTMPPNSTTLWWGGDKYANATSSYLAMYSSTIFGYHSKSDRKVESMFYYSFLEKTTGSTEAFEIMFDSASSFVSSTGNIHFIINDQDIEFSASCEMADFGPLNRCIKNSTAVIGELITACEPTQEIKIRIIDDYDSSDYVEYAFTKGNFDEVYYTEEIQ